MKRIIRITLVVALFALLPAALLAQNGLTLEELADRLNAFAETVLTITTDLDDRLTALEGVVYTPTATPEATSTPTPPPTATSTPIPTNTPTPEPTATATIAVASFSVNQDAVNVRAGPGTNYEVLGAIRRNQTFTPTGRNPAGDWLRFDFNGQQGWTYAPMMVVNSADLIPVVQPPTPAPTNTPAPTPTSPPAQANSLYGVVIASENRCSPYNADDYSYPQSVEQQIVAQQGGRIYSPYSGRYFASTSETDIEHIVARSEAHDSGLCAASADRRRAFARDLVNLTLASPSLNRHQKVAKDLAEWLPDHNRCWYVNQVAIVKKKYGLTWNQAEANKAREILQGCTSFVMIFTQAQAPAPTAAPAPPSGQNALDLYDDNGNGRITCAEARRHGIAPVRRDHPAYQYMNDRDGDGVVCE